MSNPLSNELINQFAKAAVGEEETVAQTELHGTITRVVANEGDEGELCVKIDGSDIETPVSRIPSTVADFAEGDRVNLSIKNHALTITGNTTNKSIGIMTEGNLRSEISQTASQIRLEVSNTADKLSSSITMTADKIRLEVSDEVNKLSSSIEQTAKAIRLEVSDEVNKLSSSIEQTAEAIRLEVSDEVNNLSSSIEQTAEAIRSEVTKTATELQEDIDETAKDLEDAKVEYKSLIKQSADSISSEVSKTYLTKSDASSTYATPSQVSSSINQSANSILSTVSQSYLTKTDAANTYTTPYQVSTSINQASDSIISTVSQNYMTTSGAQSLIQVEVAQTINGLTISRIEDYLKLSWCDMQSDGLYMYTDGVKLPKFSVSNQNSLIRMILGAGDYQGESRLYIDKGTTYASIVYMTSDGSVCGFQFNDDGTITLIGTWA